MRKKPTLVEIREVFLNAMTSRYEHCIHEHCVGKDKEVWSADIEPYEEGYFFVTEASYMSQFSNKSSGEIVISWHGMPVWNMSHGGFYAEEALRFLDECLYEEFRKRSFNGGRGPDSVTNGTLTYTNSVAQADFDFFSGEEIVCFNEKICCRHWYHGMRITI